MMFLNVYKNVLGLVIDYFLHMKILTIRKIIYFSILYSLMQTEKKSSLIIVY